MSSKTEKPAAAADNRLAIEHTRADRQRLDRFRNEREAVGAVVTVAAERTPRPRRCARIRHVSCLIS
jgi:hypothetical protein